MWEENWDVFNLYQRNHDQWRMAMGPVGLDMMVFNYEMEELGVTGEKREEWRQKLRVIASAALIELNRKPD